LTGPLDWHRVVAYAQRLGARLGVLDTVRRGVVVRQHHAVHLVRPKRIHCHGRDHGRIDAAGQTKHNTVEPVLLHVVAGAQDAGMPDLFVADQLARRVTALANPAAAIALPAGHGQALFKLRHLAGERPVGIEHERCPVEHQLILPADLVEIDHRQAGFGDTCNNQVQPHILLVALERRSVWHDEQFGAGLFQRFASFFGPDVFADGNADAYTPEVDRAGGRDLRRTRVFRRTRRSWADRACSARPPPRHRPAAWPRCTACRLLPRARSSAWRSHHRRASVLQALSPAPCRPKRKTA
jgi:hypothetical protein